MSRSSSRAIPIPALAGAALAPNIQLLPPLDLPAFVRLMQRADLVLTDSGGVQEEAVTLGKPVLVLREVDRAARGVDAGAAILAGTDPDRIVRAAEARLDGAAAPVPARTSMATAAPRSGSSTPCSAARSRSSRRRLAAD